MKLGQILAQEDEGRALVGRLVEFWVKKGNSKRFLVRGMLYPVSEAERQQSKRDAIKYLRTLPDYQEREEDGVKYAPPIPEMVVREEQEYRRICAALHDPDDKIAKLVPNSDYPAFRNGVILEQINWLTREYDRYIESEYPEILSDRDHKDIADEARSK